MKKKLRNLLGIMVIFNSSCNIENAFKLKEYKNEDLKIKIEIPATYIMKEDTSEGYVWYNPNDTGYGFVEHFNLLELNKPNNFKEIELFEYYTGKFNDIIQDYKIIKYENLKIRNINVQVLLFSGKINEQQVSAYFILFSEKDKLYSLTMFTSHKDQLKLFEKVFKTFEFL